MKYLAVKIFWFFVNPIKKFYWFMVRPQTRGVKCLVENNGKLLLVKLNYAHHKWTFPGGGVGKKESFLDAAIRETKEEAGFNVTNLSYVGFYKTNREYKEDNKGHGDGGCRKAEPGKNAILRISYLFFKT